MAASDLQTALDFVSKRIEQQAHDSGLPLDDGEQMLLNNLPTTSHLYPSGDPEMPNIVGRDVLFERLCALAKAAHAEDIASHPHGQLRWEFCEAVLRLNNHPMSWLLEWSGIKLRKPWWDGLLLVGAGLLFVGSLLTLMLVRGGENKPSDWVLFGGACIVLIAMSYIASKYSQIRQLTKTIESCRTGIAEPLLKN